MYFYQDVVRNLFYVGEDILPSGKYILRSYDSDNTISIESADTHELTLNPIEIVHLQKENGLPYLDLDDLLDDVSDFFVNTTGDLTDVENRLSALESTLIKVNYYEQITTLSGQISQPNGSTILLDQWSNGVDALISAISGGKPDFKDSGNDVISFDISGNYVVSPALPSNPSALIYVFTIPFSQYRTLDTDRIINYVELAELGGGGGTDMYINLVKTSQIAGDLHFSDISNWASTKALLKDIKVITTSTNWDLYLLQNNNGFAANDANVPAKLIMERGRGNESIALDYSYEDEDLSETLHLYWRDNVGSVTADFYITGVELD